MSSPGLPPPNATQLPSGLINVAPGMTGTTPGASPPGSTSGAPVTGYNPSSATASNASAANYDPNAFNVTPKQTVASQIKDIIASGSPLMEQAETNAKNMMNARGLINSSQAIGAGQTALYNAATPIAQQDANTYATAATNTTNAQNQALAAEAAAKNTANLQNSQLQTGTSQFNAGQANAALSTAAGASNTVALQAQQNEANLANIKTKGAIDLQLTQITEANKNILQSSSIAGSLYNQSLANLSAIITNPNLSEDQKTQALNDGVSQLNDALGIISKINGIPDVQSLLTFGGAGAATNTAAPADTAAAAPADTAAQADTSGIINNPPAAAPAAAGGQTPGVAAAMSAPPRTGGGNTPIQDIAQAIRAGTPPDQIPAASWAAANFGPGGAAPAPGAVARAGSGFGNRLPRIAGA